MDFASNRIWALGGEKISIGLIDSNTKLKACYHEQGYNEVCVKVFEHLSFRVCLMDKQLKFTDLFVFCDKYQARAIGKYR